MPTPTQALVRRQLSEGENGDSLSLMPPPPPPKRIKRPTTVLDEDVYTSALSHIIARDFFPGLLDTQIKQEYLDALESKNKEWIASARRKLKEVIAGEQTPARRRQMWTPTTRTTKSTRGGEGSVKMSRDTTTTPTGWRGDTPMTLAATPASTAARSEDDDKDAEPKGVIPDVSDLTLFAFQAKYTSEDNESFNKLLDKQNAKSREKHAWLWSGNKIPTARQIAYRKREAKRLADQGRQQHPSGEAAEAGTDKQLAIKTDLDVRPARPDTWAAPPRNSLMFIPSSIEDTHETVQQRAEAASRAGPKRVLYQNTRLQEHVSVGESRPETDVSVPVPPSPSMSAIKDAIAGWPHMTESEAQYTGSETPRVNGYAFVDEDEPEPEKLQTPRSSRHNHDDDDEEIDFRLLLGSGDTTPNPFEIKQNRKREELHHRMVDRVARNKRLEKAASMGKSPVPRFPSSPHLDYGLRNSCNTPVGPEARRSGSILRGKALTPAAQKLLSSVGSTPKHITASSGLRNMWAPTPKKAR